MTARNRLTSGPLHSPSRILCSFHSRYYCAIGLGTYLGFGDGATKFTRDIQRMLLRNPRTQRTSQLLRGFHPLWRHIPVDFESSPSVVPRTTTPHLHRVTTRIQFTLHRLRSPLLTASLLLSLLLPTTMLRSGRFLFPQGNERRSVQDVSFGHPGIHDSMRLPLAYRSLARPSSAPEPSHPSDGEQPSDVPCSALTAKHRTPNEHGN